MKTRKKTSLMLGALSLMFAGLLGFWWLSIPPTAIADRAHKEQSLAAVEVAPIAAPAIPHIAENTQGDVAPMLPTGESPIASTDEGNSLRGTAVDGEVSLNPDGSVRLNLELRRLFDYYLARSGEMPTQQLMLWIDAQLDANHPPAVALQLKSLLMQYRNYLRVINTETPRLEALTPRLRLQALAQLRTQTLGQAMADAFFANEHAWDTFTQDRLALARDRSLTPALRAQREQELLQQLPTELAQSYSENRDLDRKLNVALPAAEAERFAAREQLFGAEAAARFAALDQSQNAFKARVQRYLDARAQQNAISADARARLRAQYFDANESARVEALESVGQESELLR